MPLPSRRDVFSGALAAVVPGLARAEPEAGEDLRAILQERIDVGRQSTGIVAVAIDDTGKRPVAYGTTGTPDAKQPDGDTIFEIGSITKVLTALILSDMVSRGEVALSDPVAKLLPAAVKVPDYHGKPITLLDLATYTSGLPRMPDNFAPKDPDDPYVDYTEERLYAFLSGYTLRYEPGTHYEYANLGFGLLGHALAHHAAKSYEELLIERVCDPLGMNDTRVTLSPAMRSRMAQGHSSSLEPTRLWDFDALAGAGAVRSTANDLTVFLEACTGRRQTPLAAALARLPETTRPTDGVGPAAGMGWFVSTKHDDRIAWKEGGTGGFTTVIGYSPLTRRGAIVLSNAANWGNLSDIGLHLINPAYALLKQRREVPVSAAAVAGYAGTYTLRAGFAITVRADGAHLFARATKQDEYELFPESETEFFYRVVNAQVTFERKPDGTADALVLHQNGKDRRGERVP